MSYCNGKNIEIVREKPSKSGFREKYYPKTDSLKLMNDKPLVGFIFIAINVCI